MVWYVWCFSSEEVFGKEPDKGVMNLPSKNLLRLAGNLKESINAVATMAIFRALIVVLHGRYRTRAVVAKN